MAIFSTAAQRRQRDLEQLQQLEQQQQDQALGGSLQAFQSLLGVDPGLPSATMTGPSAVGRPAPVAQQNPAALAMTLAQAEQQGGLPQQLAQQGVAQQQQQAFAQSPAGRAQAAQAEQLRQLDLEDKLLANAKTAAEIRRMDFDLNQARKDPVMSGDDVMQVNSMTEALNSIDNLLYLTDQLGAFTSPAEFLAYPEAAQQMDFIESFDMVNIFKTLANDTRLSDEDREFYGGLAKPGAVRRFFGGKKLVKAPLQEIQRRLEKIHLLNSARPGVPQAALQRRQFGQDIGRPVTSEQLPQVGPTGEPIIGLTPADRMAIQDEMNR